MSNANEAKGLSPKYVIQKNVYQSIKSPLAKKQKKEPFPDQYIIFNADLSHRKLDFTPVSDDASIKPQLSPEYCFDLYEAVNNEAASFIQNKFRAYFEKHPLKVDRKVGNATPKPKSSHVTLSLI